MQARRRFEFFKCIVCLQILLLTSTARAQDLEKETRPSARIDWQRREGYGAQIDSCEVVKNRTLRCRTDRLLAKVECETRDFTGPGQKQRQIPAKIVDKAFACYLTPEEISLSHPIQVYLLGADGKFTEYSIRFSSEQNMEKIYLKESDFVATRRASFFFKPSISLNYSVLSGDLATQFYGLETRFSLGPQTFGTLVWQSPLGDSVNFGSASSVGLNWLLTSKLSAGLGAFFEQLQGGRRVRGIEVVAGLRQNLGFEKLNFSADFKLRYPNVEKIRQAARITLGLQVGPFFGRRLMLEAASGYINELWSFSSSQNWSLQALSYQLGVRWNFDARR